MSHANGTIALENVTPDPVGHAALARQFALEEESVRIGETKWWKETIKARQEKRECDTQYGTAIISRAILPVAEEIQKFIAKAKTGGAGRRHIAVKYLEKIDPKVAAFIALRACFRSIVLNTPLQQCALSAAGDIEFEVRLSKFAKDNPGLYATVRKSVEYRGHMGVKSGIYNHAMLKFNEGGDKWAKVDKLHIGIAVIEMIRTVTGLIQIVKNKDMLVISATEECLQWVRKAEQGLSIMSPTYFPCVVPPKEWSSIRNGGYHTHHIRPLYLIKTRSRNYLEEMRHKEMPKVYSAVNALQNTPWRVNEAVLRIAENVWKRGGDTAALPRHGEVRLPLCPVCGADITEEVKARVRHGCLDALEHADKLASWKKEAARVYAQNVENASKALATAMTLNTASKFVNDAAIYFVYQLDFRGRIYAVPAYLNPQGDSLSKGLLIFAEGKPLGEHGERWLAIHGANSYGIDKVSFEDRLTWIKDNEQMILETAANPYDRREWEDCDSPWQFLAFCFEWAEYRKSPTTFVSHIPVGLDGSCNGIQHFSAILRDEVGGAGVNLVPQDKPADIYQQVADVVIKKLEGIVENGGIVHKSDGSYWYDEKAVAADCLRMGITRKTTKRQVMVLPYGGTKASCLEYTIEYVADVLKTKGSDSPWDKEAFKTAFFLSNVIWSSISEVVVGAREVMGWLQDVAKIVAGEKLPITWSVPETGFLVQQWYREMKSRRVITRMGNRIDMVLLEETTNINRARQVSGIAPNFVHALDAAALMMTVNGCLETGIKHYHMIHDSYGVHAADTEILARVLREQFVRLYQGNDVLNLFLSDVCSLCPEMEDKLRALSLPRHRGLDLEKVKKAVYFFA